MESDTPMTGWPNNTKPDIYEPSERDTRDEFQQDLTGLINKYSIENICDMPDFILAEMITNMVYAMGPGIKRNLDWHGTDSVCHPKE